jgi:chaperonin GroEL
VEEGIVPGGGVALLRTIPQLEKARSSVKGTDQKTGVDIIRRAIEAPLKQIATNAGVEGSLIVQRVLSETGTFGYNARTDTFEDLAKAGVMDPTKVVRTAIENASSIAGLLLTTEAMITEVEEEKDEGHGHHHAH